MNVCILFILFNGSAHITPGCFTIGGIITPHDVVYLEQLPQHYTDIVYESPQYYLYSHFAKKHYVRHWYNYRYNHHTNRPLRYRVRRHHVKRRAHKHVKTKRHHVKVKRHHVKQHVRMLKHKKTKRHHVKTKRHVRKHKKTYRKQRRKRKHR